MPRVAAQAGWVWLRKGEEEEHIEEYEFAR